jgi:HK97 family phage prohead protease
MEKLQKLSYAKSIDSEKKTVSGYVSTFDPDRDNERFAKGAWDLSSFQKNPVVLWAHNHSEPPIGKAVDLKEDEHGLIAVTEFDSKGEKAMQIFSLFERGFLNAFSVGFIRKNFIMEEPAANAKEKVLAITEAELYEYSAVSVPANPGALVSRELAELAKKTIGPKCIETIQTKGLGEQFLVLPNGPSEEPEELDLGKEKKESQEPDKYFDIALSNIIEMARALKSMGSGAPNDVRKNLLMTAIDVLKEAVQENPEELTADQIIQLKGMFVEWAGLTAEICPEAAEKLQKLISQIDKALAGQQAE